LRDLMPCPRDRNIETHRILPLGASALAPPTKKKGLDVLGMMELDADIWRAAKALIDQYGDDAALWVAHRVSALIMENDCAEATTWARVHAAIEEWQRCRRKGEPIN